MFKADSWRARIAGVIGIAAIAGGLSPLAATGVAPACAGSAPTEAAAAAMAAACQRDVIVDGAQSEYARVVARPDGARVLESAVVPQRARQADGRWADIDLTLTSDGKGGLKPRVSIADVSFSAGGTGALVTMRRSGKSMTMSWTGALPKPVVSGDSATYRDVHKDVDLVVRATRAGFTHVLVVKTPAAAASVRQVRFRMGGDARVQRQADGSLRAVVGNVLIGRAKPALMWDSAATPTTMTADRLSTSSARGVGDLARVRSVATAISADGELLLSPDATLLDAPASAYPLYVDPDWEHGSAANQKWAYANDDDEDNEYTVARVGKSPGTGDVYRSFFEFPTTGNTPTGQVSLEGKHISSAYVHMRLKHSHACVDQANYMYLTPAINATPRASWGAMTLPKLLASQVGHANEAGGCGVIQQDMDMNFGGAAVTAQVQQAADDRWGAITFGFAARDANGNGETTVDRWMTYFPEEAKLVVVYDSKPDAPYGLQVSGVNCHYSGVMAAGSLTPTLSAWHGDADSGQSLTGSYEWVEVPAGGVSAITDTFPTRLTPPQAITATAESRGTTPPVTGAVKGKVYAFRAMSTDPEPFYQSSPWSTWCQFKVDNTVPVFDTHIVSAPAGPGMKGTFGFSTRDLGVTKFKWGWGAATNEVTAIRVQHYDRLGRPWYTTMSATFTATAPKFGKNVLLTSAVDGAMNEGFGSVEFTVGRPTPPIARWGLQTYPGTNQTAALADQQPALAGNTPLTSSNVTWANSDQLADAQMTVFDGTSSKLSGPKVLDTTKSFSVAAWAKLTASDVTTKQYSVAAQNVGTDGTKFMLWSCKSGKWCAQFNRSTPTTTPDNWPTAAGSQPIKIGVWTHLAAVYDADEHSLALYVDGVKQESTASGVTMGDATGNFQVGQAGGGNWFQGGIADVQAFDRALVAHDFTGQLASDANSGGFNEPGIQSHTNVGKWDFNSTVSCYFADLKDTCEAQDSTSWQRWMALSRGAAAGAGHSTSDSGLWLDSAYFPEDGNTETGLQEFGRSARKTGITEPNGDGQEFTLWQDTTVLRTDQSFTVSAWLNQSEVNPSGNRTFVSQDGDNVSGFAIRTRRDSVTGQHNWEFNLPNSDAFNVSGKAARAPVTLTADDIGRWVHIVGVYDAGRQEIRLYINGVRQATTVRTATPWQATGPLTIGRAKWNGAYCDGITGAVDEVVAYQGALTDAEIAVLHQQQAG